MSNSNGGHWSFIGAGSSNSATAFSNGSQCSGGVNTAIVAGASNTVNGSATNTANYSIIGAGQGNSLTAQWAAIVSGSANQDNGDYGFVGAGNVNVVQPSGQYGAIVGGSTNTESANFGFIGGGSKNAISTAGTYATVGGGSGNSANASLATVAGGSGNTAKGAWASILGGGGNVASGKYSTVPGGLSNTAVGLWSLAAGHGAMAANDGSFVWSDQSTAPTVTSTAKYQFVARASGGVTFYSNVSQTTGVKLAAGSGSWSSVSDRNVKTAIVPLDDASVLAKVAVLPVSEWSYIAQGTGVRHVGPMAQDFYAAFGVGEDNKHIATIDEDGIALAAIKGLANRTERQDGELRMQRAVIARKDRQLALLEHRVAQLATAVAALQTRR
jgi:hypothetical protein